MRFILAPSWIQRWADWVGMEIPTSRGGWAAIGPPPARRQAASQSAHEVGRRFIEVAPD
jgi:hypothetical protein